jgi:photosystem II stability/assembly factor-like uncharacterized protein
LSGFCQNINRIWRKIMRTYRLIRTTCVLAVLFLSSHAPALLAQGNGKSKGVDTQAFERLEWRSIGPANMGGRTADVEGVAGNPNIVYAGTASGGIWKTTNGGTTWTPIFERQGTISVGDIALEPNNPDVVWVGTGESNVRNSVSFGDGVYKSNDGGKTWQHMGLRDTMYISRVLVHPTNPDTVYVAALGHAFGPNEERGVFMTTERHGRRRSTSIRSMAPPTSTSIRRTRTSFTPRCGTSSASRGHSAAATKRAASTNRLMAGGRGRSSRKACPSS